MDIRYGQHAGAHIVYDAARLDHPSTELFEPAYWRARSALVGQAGGRGTTWFLRHGSEQWALRHYRRGGDVIGRFIEDSYLWTGLARTRPWREWHLVAGLYRLGLPVPQPVAARVLRRGLLYRADIITVRLPEVVTLARRLVVTPFGEAEWQRLGAMLRRFHDAEVNHADLNARNILVRPDGHCYLIDFDKARLGGPPGWREANLRRLLRSLHKVAAAIGSIDFSEAHWAALRAGYRSAGG
jgi:3-deoxy-D-manno-octulosonic acid kinase